MAPSSPNCYTELRKLTRKAAEWNPELIISTRTQRRAGRPAKRWEDDLNEFVKEATQSNDLKTVTQGLLSRKNVYEWQKKERQYTKHIVEERRSQLISD